MSDPLPEYIQRLRERDIRTWVPPECKPDKFYSDGRIKPFYGLTCIAWVDPGSELFQELCDVQSALKERLEEAGLGGVFAFLDPQSFHMTVCDIIDSSDPIQPRRANDLVRRVHLAFERIGKPGKVTCCIRGLGLKRTITALVRFCTDPELERVLDMERLIKRSAGSNVRDFAGHISLAYLVQHPGDDTDRIKEILLPYRDRFLGKFAFSRFDLTCFIDMNTYIPILTVDLEDGTVTRHHGAKERPAWLSI